MTTAPSSNEISALLVVALIIFFIARRTYGMVQGARYSPDRLFVISGFYVLIFVILAFGTLYAAVAAWGVTAYALLVPYVALPVIFTLLAAPYVVRIVRFEQRDGGQWYYRLPWHIPVVYLVLFIVRFSAEIVVYGPTGAFTYPPPAPPSGTALIILVVVDLLFGVSLGLLMGRSLGVYEAHGKLTAGASGSGSPSGPPLQSG